MQVVANRMRARA